MCVLNMYYEDIIVTENSTRFKDRPAIDNNIDDNDERPTRIGIYIRGMQNMLGLNL